jgi:hypothetical protein
MSSYFIHIGDSTDVHLSAREVERTLRVWTDVDPGDTGVLEKSDQGPRALPTDIAEGRIPGIVGALLGVPDHHDRSGFPCNGRHPTALNDGAGLRTEHEGNVP